MLRHTETDSKGNQVIVRSNAWFARMKMASIVTPVYFLRTNRTLLDDYKDYFWAREE